MPVGTVKSWYPEKGIGFIRQDGAEQDLFCHVSSLVDCDGYLQQGDTVKFKVGWDDRRQKERAVDVRRTDAKDAPSLKTPNDAVKFLAKMFPDFKTAWVAYCKQHGEGYSDPGKYEEAFFGEFFSYAGGLIKQDLQGHGAPAPVKARKHADVLADEADDTPAPLKVKKRAVAPTDEAEEDAPAPLKVKKRAVAPSDGAEEDAPVPLKAQKRVKAAEDDGGGEAGTQAAPVVEKRKLSMRKAVADEIRRINAAGGLRAEVRLGAVAASLAQLEEAAALEILGALEFQQEEVDDPNEFINQKAKVSV